MGERYDRAYGFIVVIFIWQLDGTYFKLRAVIPGQAEIQ